MHVFSIAFALGILAAAEVALAAAPEISTERLLAHTKILASDAFEGRGPGSAGEDKTVAYLEAEFRALGLAPGNPDGTYVQRVPMVGATARPVIRCQTSATAFDLSFPNECVVATRRVVPTVDVKDSELVFVGYGVVAPEYGWDDYKGIDVRGKTLLMLINDPPVPDPGDPSKLDDRTFKGAAMTYYGRWTYKYEMATEKGAAAVLIIHETKAASYPYFVVVGSWGRENFDLLSPDGNAGRVAVEGWLSNEKAREILTVCGQNYDSLKAAAVKRDFRPVALGARMSFHIDNTLREVRSRNVLARLEGSDARLKNEWVVVTAHWDHLGRNDKLEGDKIYNGALDNAVGTAGLLELARAFSSAKQRPKRSLLFLSVTGEEQGLLGAKYYAGNPLYPVERTLANLNIDGLNVWGPTRDINVIGLGFSTLDDVVSRAAERQGRVATPDSEPGKGLYYRSDHFEFAKVGVPAIYLKGGTNFVGQDPDFARRKSDDYTARDYHKVSDEVKPDWNLAGAVEDLRLMHDATLEIANGADYPAWKPGTEFKARREEQLRRLPRP